VPISQRSGLISLSTLAVLIVAAAATVTAVAAQPSPACAPVLKAMAKTQVADHASVTQGKNQTLNGITAGGVNYLQIDGKWIASPISPKDNQERSDENLKKRHLQSVRIGDPGGKQFSRREQFTLHHPLQLYEHSRPCCS
jgi:hypothetical protein